MKIERSTGDLVKHMGWRLLQKDINGQELLTIFVKRLIVYVWLAPIFVTKICGYFNSKILFKSPISRNYFERYGAINFSQILNYLHALSGKFWSVFIFVGYNFRHLANISSLFNL